MDGTIANDEEVLEILVRIADGATEALKNRHLRSTLADNLVYIQANTREALKLLGAQAETVR